MPNPAAVYCEQQGGTLMPVQTPQGVRSDCKLPNGEIIDEWTLWHREHPDTKK
ncbi:Putative hemolysin [Salmonella enterica subsp. enterica serovar Alachua str. R6-377]|nr:Putative hemolysin [Salmonella enterica subsp. enterica serovar Alachua str. R6-377]